MAETRLATPGLGTGIYTISEAARLLKVPPQTLSRWAQGYVYKRGDEVRTSGPLLVRETAGRGLLTFYDLVELFFVRKFREGGIDLPQIREAAQILRSEWDTPYPFALRKLVEMDRKLVVREKLRTVIAKQHFFDFAREFFKDFDFDEHDLASAWHPLGKEKLVVLNPKRSFGAPIDIRSGIRTEVLYRLYKAEGDDIAAVADWYEVPEEAVEQAVEFEEQWSKQAA